MYFVFYLVMVIMIVIPLSRREVYYTPQLESKLTGVGKAEVGVGVLSLGGLPPIIGFFPK